MLLIGPSFFWVRTFQIGGNINLSASRKSEAFRLSSCSTCILCVLGYYKYWELLVWQEILWKKKETSFQISGKKEDGRGCWQDTYRIQEIYLSFTFRTVSSQEPWLADSLSGFSRYTVCCLCIFGHKQEGKEDSVGGSQGDFGAL